MLHLWLIIFSVLDDVSVDSETLFVTGFVNFKIKSDPSFGGAHRSRMFVHVFIWVSTRTCMSICVCTVFLKKKYSITIFYMTKLYNDNMDSPGLVLWIALLFVICLSV
jgi:predicted phosphoadenosine phosphosulfate sulfurtransferase